MSQMVIANRLTDGRVVFLAVDGTWVESIRDGCVASDDAEAARLLADAQKAEADCHIVDPYLIQVRVVDGTPAPVAWREVIRASGPTVQTGRA